MLAETADEAIYSFELDGGEGREPEKYYVAVAREYRSWLVDTLDPALPLGLLRAMESSQFLIVESEVDPLLADRLEHEWQRLFSHALPHLQKVDVTFSGFKALGKGNPRKRVLAFSGGVDSMFSLRQLSERAQRSAEPITHLMFVSYERFGKEAGIRLDRIRRLAERLELPLIVVRTNLDKALMEPQATKYWSYQNSHEALFMSAALALGSEPVTFYFSSTFGIETTNLLDSYPIFSLLPLIMPLGNTRRVRFEVEGMGYTREEKIKEIAGYELAQEFLDVCSSTSHANRVNCSRCFKCVNTLVALDSLGALQDFRHVFDLTDWSRLRASSYWYVISSSRAARRTLTSFLRARPDRAPIFPRWILRTRLDYLLVIPDRCRYKIIGFVMWNNTLRLWARTTRDFLARLGAS